MSNNQLKVAKGMLASERPLVFEEKRPVPGKGGAAFKSLTAAVKAAEREKEEARSIKRATEHVLDIALAKLKEVSKQAEEERRELRSVQLECRFWGALVPITLMLVFVLRLAGWWPQL